MIHPVSYSPCSLAFSFILFHFSPTLAAQEDAQLASSLAHFLISPENVSLSLPFSHSFIVQYTILCLTSSHTHLYNLYVPPISFYTLECFMSIVANLELKV